MAAVAVLIDNIDIGNLIHTFCYYYAEYTCICSPGALASDILSLCIAARRGSLGPFSPSFDINKHLLASLANNLPEDVHNIVSGKQLHMFDR